MADELDEQTAIPAAGAPPAGGPRQTEVSGQRRRVSDLALQRATGHGWDQWLVQLDEVGALRWSHTDIARWIVDEHGVDSWWAQAVTVGYEQARGRRKPRQDLGGTYEVSTTTTTTLEQGPALQALVAVVQAELATPPTAVSTHTRQQTARWKLPDRTTLVAHADPTLGDRCRIGLTWSRLADVDSLGDVRLRLRGWLQTAAVAGPTTG